MSLQRNPGCHPEFFHTRIRFLHRHSGNTLMLKQIHPGDPRFWKTLGGNVRQEPQPASRILSGELAG